MVKPIISPGGQVLKYEGTGNPKRLLLLLSRSNNLYVGMGDHIASLPVINELMLKGYDLTVYANPFYKEMYERVGCEFIDGSEIYPGLTENNLPNYGAVYHLIEWSLDHTLATQGKHTSDFCKQFASFFGIEAPTSFDYVEALNATESEESHVLFAPSSSTVLRTYPRKNELYDKLRKQYKNLLYIGQDEGAVLISSLQELVNVIYSSEAVLTVDSGIFHLARALGAPVYSLWGGTDNKYIASQYDYLVPEGLSLVVQSTPPIECASPCSYLAVNGWGKEGKCKDFSECLLNHEPALVAMEFNNFYSTIRSN